MASSRDQQKGLCICVTHCDCSRSFFKFMICSEIYWFERIAIMIAVSSIYIVNFGLRPWSLFLTWFNAQRSNYFCQDGDRGRSFIYKYSYLYTVIIIALLLVDSNYYLSTRPWSQLRCKNNNYIFRFAVLLVESNYYLSTATIIVNNNYIFRFTECDHIDFLIKDLYFSLVIIIFLIVW